MNRYLKYSHQYFITKNIWETEDAESFVSHGISDWRWANALWSFIVCNVRCGMQYCCIFNMLDLSWVGGGQDMNESNCCYLWHNPLIKITSSAAQPLQDRMQQMQLWHTTIWFKSLNMMGLLLFLTTVFCLPWCIMVLFRRACSRSLAPLHIQFWLKVSL